MKHKQIVGQSGAIRAKYHALSHKRAADSSPPYGKDRLGVRLRIPIHPKPSDLPFDTGQLCRSDSI